MTDPDTRASDAKAAAHYAFSWALSILTPESLMHLTKRPFLDLAAEHAAGGAFSRALADLNPAAPFLSSGAALLAHVTSLDMPALDTLAQGLSDAQHIAAETHRMNYREVYGELAAVANRLAVTADDLRDERRATDEARRRAAAAEAEAADLRAQLHARTSAGAPDLATEDAAERACAWAEYRKDYGVPADAGALGRTHSAFCAGWDAARGHLDAGGPLR